MALLSGGNCYGNIVPRQESGGPSTQLGNGTVAVLAPDGTLVREIPLRGKQPSNLTFGGPDGKTVFVTQGDGGFIEAFRVDRPGREPCLQTPDAC